MYGTARSGSTSARFKVRREQRDRRARKVFRVLPETLAQQVLRAQLDLPVRRGCKAIKGQQDRRDHRAIPDLRVQKGHRALKVFKVCRGRLDQQDRKDPRGTPVLWVLRVLKESRVMPVRLVRKGLRVLLVPTVKACLLGARLDRSSQRSMALTTTLSGLHRPPVQLLWMT